MYKPPTYYKFPEEYRSLDSYKSPFYDWTDPYGRLPMIRQIVGFACFMVFLILCYFFG